MNEKLETKLKKLLALAERGEGGEKVNAQRMLEKLLIKHSLSLSDITDERIDIHWFKYKGKIEKRLVLQIITSIAPNASKWTNRRKRETLGADLTTQQMLEVELMFHHYKIALNDDIEALFSAFIHKNDIYPPDSADEESGSCKDQSPEEKARLFKIVKMMEGMDKTHIRKELVQPGVPQ